MIVQYQCYAKVNAKHYVKLKSGKVAKKEVHIQEFYVIEKEARQMMTLLGTMQHKIWRGELYNTNSFFSA